MYCTHCTQELTPMEMSEDVDVPLPRPVTGLPTLSMRESPVVPDTLTVSLVPQPETLVCEPPVVLPDTHTVSLVPETETLVYEPAQETLAEAILDESEVLVHDPKPLTKVEEKRNQLPIIPFERLPENVHIMQRVLHVCGNQYKHIFFLALTFRHPILVPRHLVSTSIHLTKGTCIVSENPSNLNIQDASNESVIVSNPPAVYQSGSLETHILLHLFKNSRFWVQTQCNNILYVITPTNPFKKIWKKSRKDQAMKTLFHLFEVCILQQSHFTIKEAASMRFFKRNSHKDIFKTKNWYALAWTMVKPHTRERFHHDPTSEFGLELFRIWKRSQSWIVAVNHPPKEFYTCQVMLSDSDPVGIACAIEKEHIQYVSVMIVSFTTSWFRDTNNVSCCFQPNVPQPAQCRYWIPLFKDTETWQTFSMPWYLEYLRTRTMFLEKVLNWLFVQTSEPYVHMRRDLIQVYHILTGTVQSRWS